MPFDSSAAAAGVSIERDGAAQRPISGSGRVYVVFGPPASGKGTQCKLLAEKFGFVHLSTGDVFRDLSTRGTELGLRAREFMESGCFVPDDLVIGLVRERLAQADVRTRGCLLDGFPRTSEQAEALLREVRVDGVLALHVPDRTLIQRASDRRIDPLTGDIYHLKFVPPPANVAHRLVCRDRDDERSFRQRLDVFRALSRRVLPYFSGQVWRIEATLEPAEVLQSMTRCLEKAAAVGDNRAAALQGSSCSVCFDGPANFLVVPCGHQCGCEECLRAVQRHSGRCPICRSHIVGIQRVFQCGRGGECEVGDPATGEPVPTHQDLQEKLDGRLEQVRQRDDDEWSEDDGENAHWPPPADAVSLAVAPCEDVPDEGREVDVAVTVRVADAGQRVPVDVCCVVDVSGSMSCKATYEAEDGSVRDDGLTVLDIVKHAVKTVLKSLKDGDRLALVAFSEKAHTTLPLTEMTEAGQQKAVEALESLQPGGQTNIWAGLLTSMEALRSSGPSSALGGGRLQAALLLTDGRPNVVPPRGHLAELRDYRDTHPDFSFQLNTFGFGYSLDSDLLLDLATEGNGTYAFIPDAVIVGTTFVNTVANVLSTLSQSATVSLMPSGGSEMVGPVSGGVDVLEESWGRRVRLGPLQHGQERDLVVKLKVPEGAGRPYLDAVIEFSTASGIAGRAACQGTSRKGTADAVAARARADLVRTGYSAINTAAVENKGKEAGNMVAALCARVDVAEAESKADGRILALKADAGGRMSKALNGKERFHRWGKHYLRALVRSHQLQACTNCMDPGLQLYGGARFRALRDEGDRIFLSLPAPKPTAAPSPFGSGTTARVSPAPNMATYHAGPGGGCFAPSSLVTRLAARGTAQEVPVEQICAGDLVRVAGTQPARVRCVVRIAREVAKGLVALPGGLQITPRHPVRIGGRWQLPCEIPGAVAVPNLAGYVYNLILDSCHVVLVDGVECATWGHGLQGDVVGHAFFGTQRVLRSVARLQGWEAGLVEVQGALRDQDGTVVGLWGRGQEAPEAAVGVRRTSDGKVDAITASGPSIVTKDLSA